jgi:hypothetical protein
VHGVHHLAQLHSVIAQVAVQPAPVRMSGSSLAKELHIPAHRPLA